MARSLASAVGQEHEHRLAVSLQRETHVRSSECDAFEPAHDVSRLCDCRTQELAPGRHLGEELRDLHGRPDRARNIVLCVYYPTSCMDLDAQRRVFSAGSQAHRGHGRDARECLTPEPQSGHLRQISRCLDFAGGMTTKRKLCIFGCQTYAVCL